MSLRVTAATRKTAIMTLLLESGAAKAGARFLLTDLMAKWSRTGLRDDDLATGLNELLAEGLLQLVSQNLQSNVEVTSDGHAWLASEARRLQQDQAKVLEAALDRATRPDPKPDDRDPRWFRDRRKT